MPFLLSLAWQDLRASGRSLWVFCACLTLGVSLISAGGGLFRQVSSGLEADARALFGGDIAVEHDRPLEPQELAWLQARGTVSRVVELRTMLRTADGRVQLVELQSVDDQYPLYGSVQLEPALPLTEALSLEGRYWGAAIDAVLAQRVGLNVGDAIELGELDFRVRAIIRRQPDRSLRAEWNGLPVLIGADALTATGLIQPGSRVEYEYRVRTSLPAEGLSRELTAAFPQTDWEVRSYTRRSERVTEVLSQIGSGLLLIGFSTLFIGGLGVFNSVNAYLRSKLGTLATLRAIGLRDGRLAAVYLGQILILAATFSLIGALLGAAMAIGGTALAAQRLAVVPALEQLAIPSATAWMFGVLTAVTFALPALGRALSISPAALFRGLDTAPIVTPPRWMMMTGAGAVLVLGLLIALMPDPRFGLVFTFIGLALMGLLEVLVRLLRRGARWLIRQPRASGNFGLQMAISNVYRPGSPLRPALLSLGSALTLLVASTLVVAALLRAVNQTIPDHAPALLFYDIQPYQMAEFRGQVTGSTGLERLDVAPLVLGRLAEVNGESLRESADLERARAARDEHKLSDRRGNFDDVIMVRGAWWPAGYKGPPLVVMEDREADDLGLAVGDRLRFEIQGESLEGRLVGIYAQRRLQARLWLEAMFSDGALDPYINRYVGAAYMDPQEAISAEGRVAAAMPNVAIMRTEAMLNEARAVLARAGAGLAAIAGVSLAASLLVLASVVAASRARQVYEASVLHALGARVSAIRSALRWEYVLLALLTSVFAVIAGSAIALVLLHYRLELSAAGLLWTGAIVAILVSGCCLGLGAQYLLRQMRLSPALLLRAQD